MSRRRALMGVQNQGLPAEYEELSFIGGINTFTDYVDTGYAPKNTVEFEAFLALGNLNYAGRPFGAKTEDGRRFVLLKFYAPESFAVRNMSTAGIGELSVGIDANVFHTFALRDDIVLLDGVAIKECLPISAEQFTRNVTIFLENGTSTYASNARIKYLVIWENKRIVRSFLACRRKADGVLGFYDMSGSVCPLTGTPFYINVGNGVFVAGDPV